MTTATRPRRHPGAHRRTGRLRGALTSILGLDMPAPVCAQYEPLAQIEPAWRMPYRCTEPAGHYGAHRAAVDDGAVVALWWFDGDPETM